MARDRAGWRPITLAVTGLLLVAAGVGGGYLLHSPKERLAVEVPRTLLSAPVESRSLITEYAGTGVFTAASEIAVRAAAPNGMDGLVTASPVAAGQQVPWCRPVVEVSGRPIILLRGGLPAYRDLSVGDVGVDVRRLQEALRDCGIRVGVDGDFGASTARAVKELYRAAGYRPVSSAAEGLSGVAAPEKATESGAVTDTGSGQEASAEIADASLTARPVSGGEGRAGTPGPTPTPNDAESAPASAADAVKTIIVPRAELVFAPEPVRAVAVGAPGTTVGAQPVARLAGTRARFSVSLSAAQRAAIKPGALVTVSKGDWKEDTKLTALPDRPVIDESGIPTYPVVLAPATVPPAFLDEEGQFVVKVGRAEPYELVVPVSAVYEDSNGTSFVQRLSPGTPPTQARVTVTVAASANGYVSINVVKGRLAKGDEVVVGDK